MILKAAKVMFFAIFELPSAHASSKPVEDCTCLTDIGPAEEIDMNQKWIQIAQVHPLVPALFERP
jgi:hypothetical protein